MLKAISLAAFCAPLLLAAPALAQVTQTYTYDANGRLKTVATTSSGGSHTSTYDYDLADNRTARSQVGTGVFAENQNGTLRFAALRLDLGGLDEGGTTWLPNLPSQLRNGGFDVEPTNSGMATNGQRLPDSLSNDEAN